VLTGYGPEKTEIHPIHAIVNSIDIASCKQVEIFVFSDDPFESRDYYWLPGVRYAKPIYSGENIEVNIEKIKFPTAPFINNIIPQFGERISEDNLLIDEVRDKNISIMKENNEFFLNANFQSGTYLEGKGIYHSKIDLWFSELQFRDFDKRTGWGGLFKERYTPYIHDNELVFDIIGGIFLKSHAPTEISLSTHASDHSPKIASIDWYLVGVFQNILGNRILLSSLNILERVYLPLPKNDRGDYVYVLKIKAVCSFDTPEFEPMILYKQITIASPIVLIIGTIVTIIESDGHSIGEYEFNGSCVHENLYEPLRFQWSLENTVAIEILEENLGHNNSNYHLRFRANPVDIHFNSAFVNVQITDKYNQKGYAEEMLGYYVPIPRAFIAELENQIEILKKHLSSSKQFDKKVKFPVPKDFNMFMLNEIDSNLKLRQAFYETFSSKKKIELEKKKKSIEKKLMKMSNEFKFQNDISKIKGLLMHAEK